MKKVFLGVMTICCVSLVAWGEVVVFESVESKTVNTFLACIKGEKNMEEYGKCTKVFFAEEFSQKQRKRLLSRFMVEPQLKIASCDEKLLTKAQRKYPSPEFSFICVSSEPAAQRLLILKKSADQPRLVNFY